MSESRAEALNRLYIENNLTTEDIYAHKHYKIITRCGIDKIQANNNISITYQVINCEPRYCVIKATAIMGEQCIETFGSALKGENHRDGTTTNWYVMEIAEKRAMSRAVLKLAGFYALGVMGEDESENFKKSNQQ